MQNCKNQIIAVIDSGIGGVSVLKELIRKYGAGNYIYFADNLFMPYGNKSSKWLEKRVDYIINLLKTEFNVDHVIIACNTASTVINKDKYKNVYTLTFQENKTYFATELTKKNLANISILSSKILAKNIEKYIFDEKRIYRIVKNTVKRLGLDILNEYVLACTHYELIKSVFEKFCPNTTIINNSSYLLKDIEFNNLIKELNIAIILSKKSDSMENKILKLIEESN